MKKYVLSIGAVIITALLCVVIAQSSNTKLTPKVYDSYFSYDGEDEEGQSDPNNYTWLPGGATVECDPGALHCVIMADRNTTTNKPILSGGLTRVSSKEEVPR